MFSSKQTASATAVLRFVYDSACLRSHIRTLGQCDLMSSTGAAPSKRRRPAAPAASEPGPAASLQHLISDELKAELKRNEIDDA